MTKEPFINELNASKEFFNRSTRCLTDENSGFTPQEGMMTAAQQVAHVAHTVDWFLEGVYGEGFDMDFAMHMEDVLKISSMSDARAWVEKSYATAIQKIQDTPMEELSQPFPADSPIMGGAPKYVIFPSIVEHTAHHRGVLTVYSRLLGLTPAMPYMETETA